MDKFTKLSQAIRVGAKAHPQCFGRFISYSFEGISHTCALGAAYLVMGGDPLDTTRAGQMFSERFNIPVEISGKIVDWNDKLHWSRESIADELERMGY